MKKDNRNLKNKDWGLGWGQTKTVPHKSFKDYTRKVKHKKNLYDY